MRLNTLSPAEGSKKAGKRLSRGIGSGPVSYTHLLVSDACRWPVFQAHAQRQSTGSQHVFNLSKRFFTKVRRFKELNLSLIHISCGQSLRQQGRYLVVLQSQNNGQLPSLRKQKIRNGICPSAF